MKTQFEKGEIVCVMYSDGGEERLEYLGSPQGPGDCWKLRRPKTGQLIYLQIFERIEAVPPPDITF